MDTTTAKIQAKARLDTKFWIVAWILCFLLLVGIIGNAPVPKAASPPNLDAVKNGLSGWSLHDFQIFYLFQMASAFLTGMRVMACLVLIGVSISTLKDYLVIRKKSVN